jgi:IS5 family transposase
MEMRRSSGYQGIAQRPEMAAHSGEFRVGKRQALPDTPEGRLEDLVETALAAGFCLQ